MSAPGKPSMDDLYGVVVCPGIYGGVRVRCKGVEVLVYLLGTKTVVTLATQDPARLVLRTEIGTEWKD